MAFLALVLPVVMGAIEGASALQIIGTAILSGLAFLLLRPHQKEPVFKGQSSSWGKPIDIVYNSSRVPGKVIQCSQVTKHEGKKKGKKSPATYTQTFAVVFAEGPRTILRIWADNQVIYDPRPLVLPPAWQPDHDYASGDIVIPVGSLGLPGGRQFVATTDGTSGATEPTWNTTITGITRDGTIVWQTQKIPKRRKVGKQFNFIMRIYNGDESQLPDSALEQIVGVGNQSAYRGLCYCVFEQLNISKFGNRIPNLEAEVVNLAVPVPFYEDAGSATGGANTSLLAKPGAVVAYAFVDEDDGLDTYALAEVSLTSANVLRKSAPLSFAQLGNTAAQEEMSCIAWDVPDILWFPNGPAGGPTSYDLTTLTPTGVAYTWPGTGSGINNPNEPVGISRNGQTIAGMSWKFTTPNNNVIQAVNLTSGVGSLTNATSIGGPDRTTEPLWNPVFDEQGRIWMLGQHGHLWSANISQSGGSAPVVTGMVSHDLNSLGSFSFYGDVSYNPNTKYITAWLFDNALSRMVAIDFDTVGLAVVGSAHPADDGSSQFFNPDQQGWSNKQYLAATTGTSGAHTVNTIGIYDRNAGSYRVVDWMQTWNVTNPTGGINPPSPNLLSAIMSQDGTTAVSSKQEIDANLSGTDFWFFPLMPGGLNLAQIVADVSDRIGLSGQYDYSQLASVIPRGIVCTDRMTARSFLESIQPAYFFDLTDIGTQVVGTLRSLSTLSVIIPEADLAATDQKDQVVDKLTTDRNDDREIPRDLSVAYYDYQHDYQGSATPEIRDPITNYSSGRNTLTVPCVLTPGEASNIAKRVLYMTWVERNTDKFSVTLDYLGITPADVISPVRNSYGHIVRVTRGTLNPQMMIDIEAVSEDLGVYSLVQPPALTDQTSGSFTPGQVNPVVPPLLAVMDTAVLNQAQVQEPGVYVTAGPSEFGGGYQGAIVQDSPDNSVFTQQAIVQSPAVMGFVVSGPPLPDWPTFTAWDRTNSLQINLEFGQFASASEESLVDNFTNALWMENGEIIQFATAVLLDADTNLWQISDLLRGRFGTESFTGTHGASEQVVFLDPNTVKDVAYDPSTLDQTLYWQAQNDSDTSSGLSATQTLVMTTRRLMPWAPFFIQGARDMSNDLTITGIRRMRYRGTPLWHPPETDTPITTEVDILSGSLVVRTITATASGGGSVVQDPAAFTVLYTAADQTADFGSPQASVSVKVYQLNAVRGRGYPGAATI